MDDPSDDFIKPLTWRHSELLAAAFDLSTSFQVHINQPEENQ